MLENIKNRKKIIILSPGDFYVDPAHRRMHLAVMAAKIAGRDYARTYPIFLNFSSNKQSTPLSFKMGYVPLVKRGYLNRYTLPGLFKYALSYRLNRKHGDMVIPKGNFGDIEVSEHPKPGWMADLVSRQTYPGRKIYLDQDEAFFNWRFENQLKKICVLFLQKR